jgi:hypothetical protein
MKPHWTILRDKWTHPSGKQWCVIYRPWGRETAIDAEVRRFSAHVEALAWVIVQQSQ